MGMTTEGANRSLDASYGDGHADSFPDNLQLALYQGDPRTTGVELDGGGTDYPGYVRADLTNTSDNFPDATDGFKATPAFTLFFASADWTDVPTHAGLIDADTGDLLEVFERDTGSTEIPKAGSTVQVPLEIFYDEVSE